MNGSGGRGALKAAKKILALSELGISSDGLSNMVSSSSVRSELLSGKMLRKLNPSSKESILAPLSKINQRLNLNLVDSAPQIANKSNTGIIHPKKLTKSQDEQSIDSMSITSRNREETAYSAADSKELLFSEMRLPQWLATSLCQLNIIQPTNVQQRLINMLTAEYSKRKLRSCIWVKAQTGSGKSLAYIIGLLARIHQEKELKDWSSKVWSCHHLILVPNEILGQQLLRWIKLITFNDPYYKNDLDNICKVFLSEEDLNVGKNASSTFSHIFIATSTNVRTLMAKGLLNVPLLKTIIVDEADAQLKPLSQYATAKEKNNRLKHPVPTTILLKEIMTLFDQNKSYRPQVVVTSASINHDCKMELRKEGVFVGAASIISDNKRAATCEEDSNSLSLIPSSITHQYRMLVNSSSIEELVQLVRWIYEENAGKQGVLFVPAYRSKVSMQGWLESVNVRSLILSSLPSHDHFELSKVIKENYIEDSPPLLLGSDVDSRGWDLPDLKYVIVVDLPQSPVHYQHMAGRVGRMGASGTVYTFVADQRDLEKLTNVYSRLRVKATPYLSS